MCKRGLQLVDVELVCQLPVELVYEAALSVAPYALSCLPVMAEVIAELICVAAPPYMLFAVKSAHCRSKLHTTGVVNVVRAFAATH